MKAWKIKNFSIEEIDCEELDIHKGNLFITKDEAIKTAINRVNQRITENINYLESIREDLNAQEDVIKYYVTKRNKLITEAKKDNIETDDAIL